MNSPRDDAAAFSLGVKLDSQIRGLTVAGRNMNEAQSAILTAKSALSQQMQILQRMREIAVEASSFIVIESARSTLETEIQSLYQEYQRIISTTEWNGRKLLDGSSSNLNVLLSPDRDNSLNLNFGNINPGEVFTRTFGKGDWEYEASVLSGVTPFVSEVGDCNGDGILDLVGLPISSNVITVQIGKGDGTFGQLVSSYLPSAVHSTITSDSVKVGDLNGDGVDDLAYLTTTNSIAIAFGSSTGVFTFQRSLARQTSSSSYEVKDLDLDGTQDLMLYDAKNGFVTTFLNSGSGNFQERETTSLESATSYTPSLGDIYNDGLNDIGILAKDNSVSNSAVMVFLGQGNGNFTTSASFQLSSVFSSQIIAFDHDNDGDDDRVVRHRAVTDMFRSNGNESFVQRTDPGLVNRHIVVKDLNDDGAADLF